MKNKKNPFEETDIIHVTLSLLPLLKRKIVYPYKIKLPEDVTNGQLQVLFVLSSEGETRMQDLASYLGINKQQLNHLTKALEENGYVLRKTDETNRNVVRASITNKGHKLMDSIDDNLVDLISSSFNCFSEEEKQDFAKKLRDVKNYLMRM